MLSSRRWLNHYGKPWQETMPGGTGGGGGKKGKMEEFLGLNLSKNPQMTPRWQE